MTTWMDKGIRDEVDCAQFATGTVLFDNSVVPADSQDANRIFANMAIYGVDEKERTARDVAAIIVDTQETQVTKKALAAMDTRNVYEWLAAWGYVYDNEWKLDIAALAPDPRDAFIRALEEDRESAHRFGAINHERAERADARIAELEAALKLIDALTQDNRPLSRVGISRIIDAVLMPSPEGDMTITVEELPA